MALPINYTPIATVGGRIILQKEVYTKDVVPNPELYRIMPQVTTLVTTTFYPSRDGKMNADNELRAGLALKMFEAATQLGYSVVCVDGESDAGFLQQAK